MAIKLVVAGAAGRMGSRIVQLAQSNKKFEMVYQLDTKLSLEAALGGSSNFGKDLNRIADADVVIDFTAPEASMKIAEKAAKYKKPIVIGTTGFSPAQEKKLKSLLRAVPVLKSSNMSLVVNLFFKLAKETARVLSDFEVKVEEVHHVHKKDAPSGTALQLGKTMEEFLEKKINYDSKRVGEVVGDHRVTFKGPNDQFELFHHAESRDIFALGALIAAQWLIGKKSGYYSMQDVLGLK